MSEQSAEAVGKYWSDRDKQEKRAKPPQFRAHASTRICGVATSRAGEALQIELRRRYPGRRFARAVSIGAGVAAAEIDLLAQDLVGHFEIFEYAAERIKRAEQNARKHGVRNRIAFRETDAFGNSHQPYDLVYWRNALHHMPDVRAAVEWSRANLVPGGVFVMDEYTGPNRLQYTQEQRMICDDALSTVPDSYFFLADGTRIGRKCVPPSKVQLIRRDPSEAPDSQAILPAVRAVFPQASVIRVGGLIYFAGLRRIFHNFDGERDRELIDELLRIDGELADRGESLFHVAFAENVQALASAKPA